MSKVGTVTMYLMKSSVQAFWKIWHYLIWQALAMQGNKQWHNLGLV